MDALSAELADRGKDIPAYVDRLLTDLPPGTHPMTQFSIAVLALQVRPLQLISRCILVPQSDSILEGSRPVMNACYPIWAHVLDS